MKQIVITKAIIKHDQKVLLLKRSIEAKGYRGLYELPGGKVSIGEDPKAALDREVTEETGRNIQAVQIFDICSLVDTERDIQYIVVVFLAALSSVKDISVSSEHSKYSWKSMQDIQLNEVTDITKIVLKLQSEPIASVSTTNDLLNTDDKNTTNERNVIVYCDGGSRGNPGPSASGFVVLNSREQLIFEGGKYLGVTTNNQAEYQAVKLGLDKAIELGAREIEFRLDSLLVVNQMNGVYQIRNRDLWPIHAYIKETSSRLSKVTFVHVRREFNKEADAMVNKILDEHV